MEKSLHLEKGDLDASKREAQLLNDELKIVDKKLIEVGNSVSSIKGCFKFS
jgi:hypothetical protein